MTDIDGGIWGCDHTGYGLQEGSRDNKGSSNACLRSITSGPAKALWLPQYLQSSTLVRAPQETNIVPVDHLPLPTMGEEIKK